MKVWKKCVVLAAALLASVMLFTACVGTPPTVSPEKAAEVQQKVSGLIDDMLEGYGVDETELPESVKDAIESAGPNIIQALNAARITDAEIDSVFATIDNIQEAIMTMNPDEYSPEAMVLLAAEAMDIGISDEKVATFIYELLSVNKSILEAINTESGGVMAEEIKLYNDILIQKSNFITSFSTVLKLARTGYSADAVEDLIINSAYLNNAGFPTKNEFADMYSAYRTELLSMLDILGTTEINAMVSLAKLGASYGMKQSGIPATEISQMTEYFDKVAGDYAKARTSAIAVLNALTTAQAEAFYTAVLAKDASDLDAGMIIIGKALYAGATASGGADKAFVKKVVQDYMSTESYWGAEDKAEMESFVDEAYAVFTVLNGLNATDAVPAAVLETEFGAGMYYFIESMNDGAQEAHRAANLTLAEVKADFTAAGYTVKDFTTSELAEFNTTNFASATKAFYATLSNKDGEVEAAIYEFANEDDAREYYFMSFYSGGRYGKFVVDYEFTGDLGALHSPTNILLYGYQA